MILQRTACLGEADQVVVWEVHVLGQGEAERHTTHGTVVESPVHEIQSGFTHGWFPSRRRRTSEKRRLGASCHCIRRRSVSPTGAGCADVSAAISMTAA